MKNFADYMILPEFRLILECCKGNPSVDDAIYMKKTELSDDLYNPGYNIIVDLQELETLPDSSVMESATTFYNFLKDLDIESKVAFLTTEPNQVVISLILKDLNDSYGTMKIEVFSTVEAASRFLDLPVESFGLINNKIIKLRKNIA